MHKLTTTHHATTNTSNPLLLIKVKLETTHPNTVTGFKTSFGYFNFSTTFRILRLISTN